MKLTKLLLYILIITLPLIHGRIFQTLWVDFALVVSGNFEFTKAIYFNIFSTLIFTVFFVEYIFISRKKILLWSREKNILTAICITLWTSTYFSLSPFTSLIWDLEKWHTTLLYIHIIWLYIVFRQLNNSDKIWIIHTFIASGILAAILAIKELYYPSFDYGALSVRALGSLWHPNYLSGFLLLLLPFIFSPFPFAKKRIQVWIQITLICLFLTTIILCQSIFALFLSCIYIWCFINKNTQLIPSLLRIGLGWGIFFAIIVIWALTSITLYMPDKLHSFLSRFYLWETTFKIILSDYKILFFWAGLETLPYFFNSFKVPELYIYENFGFSADRPHNFILNIFYHFGLLWISIFFYFLFLLQRKYLEVKRRGDGFKLWEYISFSVIILFLLYWVFHYFSVVSYLLIIFVITLFLSKKQAQNSSVKLLMSLIVFISIIWAFSSLRLYAWEVYYKKWEERNALEMIFHPKYFLSFWETDKAQKLEWIISEKNYKTQIILSQDKQLWCDNFTKNYPSVENYFYCAEILEKQWKDILSKKYYNTWLTKLPDLWNENSVYWDNYFIKNTITGNRFFAPKFWDIRSVLEKVQE